jgi:hypothetical protein
MNKKEKNENLAADTLSKGVNYFSDGLDQLSLAKKQGQDIQSLAQRFVLSNEKHREVFIELSTQGTSLFKNKLQHEMERIVQLGRMAMDFTLK